MTGGNGFIDPLLTWHAEAQAEARVALICMADVYVRQPESSEIAEDLMAIMVQVFARHQDTADIRHIVAAEIRSAIGRKVV